MTSSKTIKILTNNQVMKDLIRKVDKIVKSESSVLLVGETGVGKEVFAEYIHRNSKRSEQPFVKIGLSALPEDLLASELFGHERGSFTSAMMNKKGLFEVANSGSIFLDDIDDVTMAIQTKLLRVLESHELMRIGGTVSIPVDVRLITASKVDLKLLIEQGKFRSDLFYRINVVPINIPPLRERRDDIPLLANHFLDLYAPEKNIRINNSAMQAMTHYNWPGNVRELRNLIQRLSLFIEHEITTRDLPPEIQLEDPEEMIIKACDKCFLEREMTFEQVVSCLEKNLLRNALDRAEGNQTKAAQILKMSLSTFRDKCKKHEAFDKDDRSDKPDSTIS